MQEKKKILMLGGTGAMGMYLAPEMVKLGYRVYITSRKEHPSTDDIIYITGNAKDKAFVEGSVGVVSTWILATLRNQ